MTLEPAPITDSSLGLPVLLSRLAAGLVVLVGVGFALGLVLRAPIQFASAWFVSRFGLVGVFALVLLIDATPFAVAEPVMFLGVEGGLGFWPVALASGLGSWLSGPTGWGLGRVLGQWGFLQRQLRRYRIDAFMARYGAATVAVGAITPFPYAVTTWAAGASGVPLRQVMLGAVLRFPKCILYLGVVVGGWWLGG